MERIVNHPILTIPQEGEHTFLFNGKPVTGMKGFTIAAALHQAGYPVHSHSVNGRNRSLNCGIGKCGACEMLVDGEVKRICITKVDNVKEVSEITVQNYTTDSQIEPREEPVEIYRTDVAIIGAGPAGLACRETLKELGLNSIVIDSNDKIGGQFLMQTHAFFFFEKERRFGGMRGFDIAKTLAGDDHSGIFLHSTVWDILQNKRIAVKDMLNHKNFYVEAQALIVATGAVPFMPTFENDDVPGVYTAAVVQKMMNAEFTLLGKNILTVGAGNIGYLTSYQLMQAGAKVKAILEAMPHEGGFPVQANRIRRLGIPIYTSHMLLKAIPDLDRTGITGAVVCECENFKPIPGTEKVIDGIDVTKLPEHKRAKYLGRVFQDPMTGTAATMGIEENLALAKRRGKSRSLKTGITKKEREEYKELLKSLDLSLEERMTSKVGLLSGGQRQALTLLMATLQKPKLLLLDEHTAALDPKTAAKVLETTEKIVNRDKLTTLMITHNMKDAIVHGNRLIMLKDGHVILDIRGEEKKKLTVEDLLHKFEAASGDEFLSDQAILG